MLIAICCLMIFWTLSRYGFDAVSMLSSWNKNTTQYIASPKNGFARINVREGPGTQFSISREIERGAVVVGGEKRRDNNGEIWVALKDGGFVKETVLVEAD
jgi:hypothetical protein